MLLLALTGSGARDIKRMYRNFEKIRDMPTTQARALTESLVGTYLVESESASQSELLVKLHPTLLEFFALYPELRAVDDSFTLSVTGLQRVKDPDSGRSRGLILIGRAEMVLLVVRPQKAVVYVFDEADGLQWSGIQQFPTIWHVPVCYALQAGKVKVESTTSAPA